MNRNNNELCKNMLPTLQRVAGKDKLNYKHATTGSEDFSYFSQKIPGFILAFWKCTFRISTIPIKTQPSSWISSR
ncbi:hypothetical protein [Methanobacterium sp. SMA-27]|uniref:hypothetical protein n=1 Tax=Methanobacterium sp. SMA-27 TaxID=1495336 RepID=UPI001E3E90EB|nr:hypothetical protein [Methanobacterium sp. SMA-27]